MRGLRRGRGFCSAHARGAELGGRGPGAISQQAGAVARQRAVASPERSSRGFQAGPTGRRLAIATYVVTAAGSAALRGDLEGPSSSRSSHGRAKAAAPRRLALPAPTERGWHKMAAAPGRGSSEPLPRRAPAGRACVGSLVSRYCNLIK